MGLRHFLSRHFGSRHFEADHFRQGVQQVLFRSGGSSALSSRREQYRNKVLNKLHKTSEELLQVIQKAPIGQVGLAEDIETVKETVASLSRSQLKIKTGLLTAIKALEDASKTNKQRQLRIQLRKLQRYVEYIEVEIRRREKDDRVALELLLGFDGEL